MDGGRAVREHPLEEVYLQQGLEGSEMENLHREEKGGQVIGTPGFHLFPLKVTLF